MWPLTRARSQNEGGSPRWRALLPSAHGTDRVSRTCRREANAGHFLGCACRTSVGTDLLHITRHDTAAKPYVAELDYLKIKGAAARRNGLAGGAAAPSSGRPNARGVVPRGSRPLDPWTRNNLDGQPFCLTQPRRPSRSLRNDLACPSRASAPCPARRVVGCRWHDVPDWCKSTPGGEGERHGWASRA